jgi:hypothetical protein
MNGYLPEYIKSIEATLTVLGPVRPGQPINLNWDILAPTNLGNVTATIAYIGQTLYTSKSIAMRKNITLNSFGAGETNLPISVTTGSAPATLGLYQIPAFSSTPVQTLDLSITADGSQKGPFTGSAELRVLPEAFNSTWWEWASGLNHAQFSWNTPYTIGGLFFNKSLWSIMKVTITLMETDTLSGQVANRGPQTITANISKNANDVEFSSITQNWAWVQCPQGSHGAPTSKTFDYSVIIAMSDNWGNSYPSLTVGALDTQTVVSPDKQFDSTRAISFTALAASTAVAGAAGSFFTFGISAAVGAAAAAGFLAVANGWCGQAQDPPTPDFDYLKSARTILHPLPESLAEGNQFSETRAFLKLAIELLGLTTALGQIEGKLIAARIDKSAKGVNFQTTCYRNVERQLMQTAEAFRSVVPKVVAELGAEAAFSSENIRDAIRSFQMYGIPASLNKGSADAKCSCANTAVLEGFIKSADPTTFPTVPEILSVIERSSLLGVKYIHENMHKVLTPVSGRSKVKKAVSRT